MTPALGHGSLSAVAEVERPQRQESARAELQRWTEAIGANLLVVDPRIEPTQLCADMSARGVHVTWVSSTLEGLIEFGRTNPTAVIIAPEATGISATDFVTAIRQHGSPFVIASLESAEATEAGPLMLAGAAAGMTRPYTAMTVWELLKNSSHALDGQARVSYGPIELDSLAYTVRVHGERIGDLPLKEFELLRTLMYRAPEVLTNADLRSSLWGSDDGGPADNAIAVHVARLRTRLEGVAKIRRIRGRGYSLTLE
ncbi:putative Response regulator receiver protein [metagenome]|uniref:Putative Response regulator receiver protein n=1 Tax=metagenome TaxID=256318 RepID=A0A2P2BY04_9ZZZZ